MCIVLSIIDKDIKLYEDGILIDLNDIGVFAEEKIKITDYTTITAGVRADFISAKLTSCILNTV